MSANLEMPMMSPEEAMMQQADMIRTQRAMMEAQAAAQEEAKQREEAANAGLLRAIREREDQAFGQDTDTVNTERAQAIDYYLGKPFGNEIEGRSQVVSKDVFDTVEWIKPALMRIFAGGDKVCEFSPQGEEDIAAAEQEGDYVDYVIQRKNPWFMLAHEWFTDALLTKNAYALCSWEDKSEPVLERYKGLSDDQVALIAMDGAVQIVAHQAYQAPAPAVQDPAMAMAIAQGMMPAPGPITLHDVDVRRVKPYGCAKIEVLPPERCLVANDARGMSVRESGFFEYWEYKTLSDLRGMGFDVPDDISDTGGLERGPVDESRDASTQQAFPAGSEQVSDSAMRKVRARMIWIRNDYDGDGIAELRYIVAVGDTFLVNQECSGTPVASIVPYPMPHRHMGLSMYDVLADLQLIKSAMLRAGIDNQYLANNGRTAVDKNLVNLDDMLVSRPGGVVRVDGAPANAILPFTHPNTVPGTIAMIEYLDGIRQDRGGVQKPMAGADINSISAQPGTVAQLAAAASQKIELIARIFGEGVKELFQIVHQVTLENPTVVDKVELRGKWVTIDPRQWKKRSDMNLAVGMGVGSRPQQIASITSLLALQEKALGVGLTDLSKIYNGLSEYVKALGFASAKQFFVEPAPGAKPQPAPDPLIVATQIKAQADQEKTALQQQGAVIVQSMKNHVEQTMTQMKAEAEAARTFFEQSMQTMRDREELALRAYSEATERAQEARISASKPAGPATVQITGLDDLKASAKKAHETAQMAVDEVAKVKEEMKKKRKRKVTAPSGKSYTVEDA